MIARGADVLREVSALRALCLRLPHLETPSERRRLARFERIVTRPAEATHADAEAIAAGWARWWRRGDRARLLDMSRWIAPAIVDGHRTLATLSVAARLAQWRDAQEVVWRCEACVGHARVQTDLRQQTEPWLRDRASLLLISLAPPFASAHGRTRARSATNGRDDRLRRFVEETLERGWDELVWTGMALAHAAKCAIVPSADGYQNPPDDVIRRCAPRHLSADLALTRPAVVVTLGTMAYRALVRAIPTASTEERTLRLSRPPAPGAEIIAEGLRFRLFVAPFIRPPDRRRAAALLRQAATAAGL
jgi:uracil-DNA glycosylase